MLRKMSGYNLPSDCLSSPLADVALFFGSPSSRSELRRVNADEALLLL